MTSEEQELLRRFEVKVKHLMFLHDELKAKNEQALREIEDKQKAIDDLRMRLDVLQSDYNNLKSATAISLDGGDVRETRQRLSKLVRDVDKCISMLNQQ